VKKGEGENKKVNEATQRCADDDSGQKRESVEKKLDSGLNVLHRTSCCPPSDSLKERKDLGGGQPGEDHCGAG